ncbi:MAG TPA: trehalase family glycosidase, partial [Dongiaceae bacterium]|nr:trehalase family glycosidase [Dongiaceae bacterium]
MTVTITAARDILRANDRGGYTVPTSRLYPFQWNWDSAFVALGWATFDETRAWRELERLVEGQWDDGMLPHIIFHAPSDEYFPGPDVWGTHHEPPTSGITQPPVLATSIRLLLDGAARPAEVEARAAALYPHALALHRWWAHARDPLNSGLVAILHPWESGMDNSPAWDAAMARVPAAPSTPIKRRDIGHVHADMRPSQADYERYIMLVDLYRSHGWSPEKMWETTPFKVADIAINAILHRAESDLRTLAGRFGTPSDRAEIELRLERQRTAIASLWSEPANLYESMDLMTGARIEAATSGGFLPLFANIPSSGQAARMAREIERWGQTLRYLVPSLSPFDARFEPKRYWRGPVWAIVNRMIAEGLNTYGHAALADRIREDTRSLMRQSGFAEYYDPVTGEGLGGASFSWTAAMA